MDASQIGKRAWSYAGVLQDAGLSCFEYVEQLTLLLFLKMADQLTRPPYERAPLVPPEFGWQPLLRLDGAALEAQFRKSLGGTTDHWCWASAMKHGVALPGRRCASSPKNLPYIHAGETPALPVRVRFTKDLSYTRACLLRGVP